MKNYMFNHAVLVVILSAFSCAAFAKKDLYFNKRFAQEALVNDEVIYNESKDYIAFWEKCAHDLSWFKKWDTVLEWESPYAKWFLGGKINVSYNCLDRHIEAGKGDRVAFYYRNEDGERRTVTYDEMYYKVNKLANVLKSLGVQKGDRVAIYMPLLPESIAGMLACARIGAVHTVIFGGIGAGAVKDRIQDADAKVLLTVDAGHHGGKLIIYKNIADSILAECPSLEKVLVLKRSELTTDMKEGRDFWYHEQMHQVADFCEPEVMDSEDPLFILYTSGTTGKPKGVLHSTAGYLLGTHMTYKWVFDSKPEDVYWCTADIGWITGHSYVVYGPMSNGATQVIYDGSFAYPKKNVFSEIIDEYKVTIFYTAPTLIRLFMKWGEECLKGAKFDSLRLLGSIGEPINPETWQWYFANIGRSSCPIVDTWFQTETGALVISPLPGLTKLKPGSITQALPGFDVAVLDEQGHECSCGSLAIRKPFPSMMRGVYKDHDRYVSTYWNKWEGRYYYAGDHARMDKDNYIWVGGRSDEVLKVSGHRIGAAEIENALIENRMVAESAVVGVADEIKGSRIVAFVVLKDTHTNEENVENGLKQTVAAYMGAYARPDHIILVKQLPKNRSGKILRRILKNAVEKKELGSTVTLLNKDSLEEIIQKADELNKIIYGKKEEVFAFEADSFEAVMHESISRKWPTIIDQMKRNVRNPICKYSLQSFNCGDDEEVAYISQLLRDNFLNHPTFKDVPQEIKALYCNANSASGLRAVLEKEHTYAFVLKADDAYIGMCIIRFDVSDRTAPFLHIKRMHAFHNTSKGQFAGVGKAMLNVVATVAQAGGIQTLFTTSPYTIQGFFEHLGWSGHMIHTDFFVGDAAVNLPQFKCTFKVTNDFKGF